MQKDIQSWLSSPDPWKNHNIALGSRHNGTATWFVQGDTFSQWKSSGLSSLLWIHANRQLLSSPLGSTDSEADDPIFHSGCREKRALVR